MASAVQLVEHIENFEVVAEKEITDAWKENWLPFHINNPLIPTDRIVNLTHLMEQEEYAGMTSEEVKKVFWEKKEAKKLMNSEEIEELSPETVLNNLQTLRNFAFPCEDLSAKEQSLLNQGKFLLYKVDVPRLCIHFYKNEQRIEATTLCFIKSTQKMTMYVLSGEGLSTPYSFGPKSWFYRAQVSVVFCLSEDRIHRIKFNSVEDAVTFELYFMFVAEFSDKSAVLHLRGTFPAQQLISRGFEGGDKYKEFHVEFLKAFTKSEEANHTPNLNMPFPEFMENVRARIEEYVREAYRLQVFLFKSCIPFHFPKEIRRILDDMLLDRETLLKIAMFCVLPKDTSPTSTGSIQKRSIEDLIEDLLEIADNLDCCLRMSQTGDLYREFILKYLNIRRTVYGLFAAIANQDDVHNEFTNPKITEIRDSEMTSNIEVSKNAAIEPSKFHLMEKMGQYLGVGHPSFLDLFSKLDKILRVGGTNNIFDILRKNMKSEFVEILFNLKTVVYLDKEFFGETWTNIQYDRTEKTNKNSVRLSELAQFNDIFSSKHTTRDAHLVELGERIVCQKIYKSVELLVKFSKEIEEDLDFNMEQWLDLVSICRIISEDDELVEVMHEVEFETTTCSTMQPSNSSSNSYEKITIAPKSFRSESFTFPNTWKNYNKYEKKDFRKVKNLGRGAYGCAKILQHDNWRNVVLKKYSFDTTAADITKEIDMLIRLQSNLHIVKFFGFYYSSKDYFEHIPDGILLEYIERNLHKFIHAVHSRNEKQFKHIYRFHTAIEQMQGMASAFAAMYAQRIMHRDIKPDNILLTYEDKIQVCDLGMCGSIDKTSKTNKYIGTLEYKAPEIHDGEKNYTEKVDVFSLGVTMWEQIHRRIPYSKFKNNSDIIDFVCEGNRLEFDDSCLPQLKIVIQKAWTQNPDERPSMEQLEEMLETLLNSLTEEDLEKDVLKSFDDNEDDEIGTDEKL